MRRSILPEFYSLLNIQLTPQCLPIQLSKWSVSLNKLGSKTLLRHDKSVQTYPNKRQNLRTTKITATRRFNPTSEIPVDVSCHAGWGKGRYSAPRDITLVTVYSGHCTGFRKVKKKLLRAVFDWKVSMFWAVWEIQYTTVLSSESLGLWIGNSREVLQGSAEPRPVRTSLKLPIHRPRDALDDTVMYSILTTSSKL